MREGPAFAANAEVRIRVFGKGGHAALPHLSTDQVLAAARVIEALQAISARRVAPAEPVAVTIAKIHGGDAKNVIPPAVMLEGTLRAMRTSTLEFCAKEIERIATAAAATCGSSAEVTVIPGYPAVENHSVPTRFIRELGEALLGKERVKDMPEPTMGSEDFSFFLQRIPGSYFLLGMDDGRAGGYPSLHHPAYDFNDRALSTGIGMFVHAALAWADYAG